MKHEKMWMKLVFHGVRNKWKLKHQNIIFIWKQEIKQVYKLKECDLTCKFPLKQKSSAMQVLLTFSIVEITE